MIVGYEIMCSGMSEPRKVSGSSYDECLKKFRDYYECDYDYDTDKIISMNAIIIKFDIE